MVLPLRIFVGRRWHDMPEFTYCSNPQDEQIWCSQHISNKQSIYTVTDYALAQEKLKDLDPLPYAYHTCQWVNLVLCHKWVPLHQRLGPQLLLQMELSAPQSGSSQACQDPALGHFRPQWLEPSSSLFQSLLGSLKIPSGWTTHVIRTRLSQLHCKHTDMNWQVVQHGAIVRVKLFQVFSSIHICWSQHSQQGCTRHFMIISWWPPVVCFLTNWDCQGVAVSHHTPHWCPTCVLHKHVFRSRREWCLLGSQFSCCSLKAARWLM